MTQHPFIKVRVLKPCQIAIDAFSSAIPGSRVLMHKVKDFVSKHRHSNVDAKMVSSDIPATMKAAQLVAVSGALYFAILARG